MYYIYVDGINSFSNEFAQIGLSIRKLNKKEKTIIDIKLENLSSHTKMIDIYIEN